jgi:hypothetical protein
MYTNIFFTFPVWEETSTEVEHPSTCHEGAGIGKGQEDVGT